VLEKGRGEVILRVGAVGLGGAEVLDGMATSFGIVVRAR